MNEFTPLPAWALLTATAALLAFLVSVYALVGRERKSPYLVKSVFIVFVVCLFGAVFDLASAAFPRTFVRTQTILSYIGLFFLVSALALSSWKIWTIWIRLTQFVDPVGLQRFRKMWLVRRWRRWRERRHPGASYEYDPVPFGKELQAKIAEIVRSQTVAESSEGEAARAPEIRDASELRSLAVALRHQGQANEVLSQLAETFLVEGKYVQYMTASRHPIEFVSYLKRRLEPKECFWEEYARKKIVAVDAFTPHFGFADAVNDVRTRELENVLHVHSITSTDTYAGLHTASSMAFKWIQKCVKETGGDARTAALLIYEDCFALTDLESIEQYRIFVRHIMPSERIWDSMFTVFTETAQPEAEWQLIGSYAGMILDLRGDWPAPPNGS